MSNRSLSRALAALAAAAIATGLSPALAKDWKVVNVATEAAYEPWNLTRPDGTIDGFEPELLKDLCGRMKVECKVISQDWDGMFAGLNAGKFDVAMDAISISDERKKAVAFTLPYAATPATFVADKTGPSANLPGTGTTVKLAADGTGADAAIAALKAALKGKTIGIQTATIYSDYLKKTFGDVVTFREYKTAPEHDLDVASGRVDLAFDDATYFTSAFSKPDNQNLAFSGPEIAGAVWGPGEAFAMRQADTDLIAMFDTAIKAAIADGTVKRISEKWFKLDVTP